MKRRVRPPRQGDVAPKRSVVPAHIPAFPAASVALSRGDLRGDQGLCHLSECSRHSTVVRRAEGHVLGGDEERMLLGGWRGRDGELDEVRRYLVGGGEEALLPGA